MAMASVRVPPGKALASPGSTGPDRSSPSVGFAKTVLLVLTFLRTIYFSSVDGNLGASADRAADSLHRPECPHVSLGQRRSFLITWSKLARSVILGCPIKNLHRLRFRS